MNQVSLSRRAWTALSLAFAVLTLLLGLTAVTLISQRQRTVLLNKQLGALVGEATVVIKRVQPALDALPANGSTISSRARSASDLVSEARPLIQSLNASGLPDTVSAAGQLLRTIDQPGAVAHTLANLDQLSTAANQAGIVPRLVPLLAEVPAGSHLISELTSLVAEVKSTSLVPRALGGLNDLAELVRLQVRSVAVQQATLVTAQRTGELTGQALKTARTTLATAERILAVAEQTLLHAANIDRKTGPAPPSTGTLP
jgi:hypothetical protein